MKYSVTLESPFAFSSYWYAVGAGLIVLGLVLWIAGGMILDRIMHKDFLSKHRLAYMLCRDRYLKQIDEIEAAFAKGELDTRGVCQRMSISVRSFVRAVTGWRADKMVYRELVGLGRPELAELVRQYYEPEFAYYSEADAKLAIERGKELVRKWV